PAWMLRAGLFLYDILARRELLPGSRGIDLREHISGKPLKPEFTRGFVYSDGWVDDARLVVLNALDAAEKGATILTRTCCESAQRQGGRWVAHLRSGERQITVNARCLVNAAGPWSVHFLQAVVQRPYAKSLRLIKGSHIVVKRLFDHPYAYIFQHPDGRIVFAIPYEQDFTLIGTTDLDYQGDVNTVVIDQDEINYLCDLTNRYFCKPVVPGEVVWSYSGVRPLVEDEAASASAVTRDYRLELDKEGAPLLSVFGGKITTFRKLAEEALDMLSPLLPARCCAWTENACLPGGDVYGDHPANRSVLEFDCYVHDLQQKYTWLRAALVARYARAYGTRADTLLAGRHSMADMGEEIASGLYAAEVDYLMRCEWAVNAADILWRRSKLGLHLPKDAEAKLDAWMQANRASRDNRGAVRSATAAV
ncbi:MAG TPA: glycerol-3-phosphate dehydrogenase, partial [Noviherbaspirillum sp.]